MGVCEFINQVQSYKYLGQTYSYTTLDYAKWASYQSRRSPHYGELPVAYFIVQWGWETGWGGTNWTQYRNTGEQADSCGIGNTCGTQPNGFPIFCTIRDGVMAYTNLLLRGYAHVQYAYTYSSNPNLPDAGIDAAFEAVGRGYHTANNTAVDFCGWSGTANSSTSKRLWDAGGYNDGSGPGSNLKGTFHYSGNQCIRDLNYVQTTNPNLTGFVDVSF